MVAGPSGVGKTTMARAVARRRPDVYLSTSATTRGRRDHERDGDDYHFLDEAEFERLAMQGAFLETAHVHGRARYGTLRGPVLEALEAGRPVLLEIDVQGARQVKRSMPEAVLVFIRPPSWDVLEARLRGRGSEDPQSVERRLQTAREELAAADDFEHSIVNHDLDEAISQLIRILDGA